MARNEMCSSLGMLSIAVYMKSRLQSGYPAKLLARSIFTYNSNQFFFCRTRIWQNHITFLVVQNTQNHFNTLIQT